MALLNPVQAQMANDAIPEDVQQSIRKEAMDRSSILRTLHFFTDVYGPRLTGSPNLKNADDWAVKQLTEWGLSNAHLESWNFGHPGWVNEKVSAYIVSPVKDTLTVEVLAWTPGTNGTVTGDVFQFDTPSPSKTTQSDLTEFLNGLKDKVKGKIIMTGPSTIPSIKFDPQPKRMDEVKAKERFSANPPAATPSSNRPETPKIFGDPNAAPTQPKKLTGREIYEQTNAFLKANGALLQINDAKREHRQIAAFNNPTFDPSKVLPTVILSNEDFGRIFRILADGTPVKLEFNIVNKVFPEGKTAYNVIAEIPGTDKKDEVIMLGGHLDSWHAATGATDNAIGCAVMMEAVRILQKSGFKPRRTIRIALWSGEEQGLLGSKAYVAEHFGTAENPKPEYSKFGGYFNIDTGTGKARGMSVFGPPQAAEILRTALTPYEDIGFIGTVASTNRNFGGSDHTSFNNIGLPGIGIAQDPIEYFGTTWHTNVDTYERIVDEDAKKSAIVIASAVYALSMRDDLLPRLTK